MKNVLRTLLPLLLVAALLAACAPSTSAPVKTEIPAAETAAPATEPAATEAPVVETEEPPAPIIIEDALGRTVTLEQPPSRIAIVGFANLMLVDEAYLFPEAADKVVAIAKSGQGNDFLYLLDPNAEEKLSLEGSAGPEQIAAVNPDLILIKDSMAKKLGEAVESLGVPVLYISSETPEEFFKDIEHFGVLFQNEARAQEIIAYYQTHMERIENAVKDLNEDEKPSVLFLQYSTKGGEISYKVPPAEWMQTTMLQMAGGAPVWLDAELGSRWTVIGLEQVAVWDPDKIFIVDYFGDTNEAIRQMRENPLTQGLKAVQNDQIFAVPKDFYAWDQPDPRWILCVSWMAKQMHPELFADLDIEGEVYDFYRTLYGLSDASISDNILPLTALTPLP